MTANKILQSNIGKLRENCNDDLRLSISALTPIIRLDFKRPEKILYLKCITVNSKCLAVTLTCYFLITCSVP